MMTIMYMSSVGMRVVTICMIIMLLTVSTITVSAQPLTLPALPYSYDALEPVISERTMRVHHLKHHQTYTNNLNAALITLRERDNTKPLVKKGIDYIMSHLREINQTFVNDNSIMTTLRNDGGGYVNHAFFFSIINGPPSDTARRPTDSSAIATAIIQTFGSFDSFMNEFSSAAVRLFGSGWTWLYIDDNDTNDSSSPTLRIGVTVNQDSVVSDHKYPLLAFDCWEHAYYLSYENRRAEYMQAFWRIVDWEQVERLYQQHRNKHQDL